MKQKDTKKIMWIGGVIVIYERPVNLVFKITTASKSLSTKVIAEEDYKKKSRSAKMHLNLFQTLQ